MEIKSLINAADKTQLLEIKKMIDNRLQTFDDPNLGGMKISDFIAKIEVEKKGSTRLIQILRNLSSSHTYLFEIKEETFRGYPNSGLKTYNEFIELRGF